MFKKLLAKLRAWRNIEYVDDRKYGAVELQPRNSNFDAFVVVNVFKIILFKNGTLFIYYNDRSKLIVNKADIVAMNHVL